VASCAPIQTTTLGYFPLRGWVLDMTIEAIEASSHDSEVHFWLSAPCTAVTAQSQKQQGTYNTSAAPRMGRSTCTVSARTRLSR